MEFKKVDGWQRALDMLSTTHTLSTKQICKLLKTSRGWVNKNISPYVDRIYIANGRGDKGGMSWLFIASGRLGKKLTETVWFNEKQFHELIEKNVSCTKQVKRVPKELFVEKKSRAEFVNSYNALKEKLREAEKNKEWGRMPEILEKEELLLRKNLSSHGKNLLENFCHIPSKRGGVPHESYEYPDAAKNIKNWIAPHDVKDYGDTDEEVYRRFFDEGCVRISLKIGTSEKTYYIADPEPIESAIDDYYLLEQKQWEKSRHLME